jgi:hypothetical protein
MLTDVIRKETGIYFPMYKSLWDLAKGKDTDEKRLAFYDTILDAAFDPEHFAAPEQPVKGVSKPIDYARWDAWNSVMHILDRYFKVKHKRDMGRIYGKKGGRPRKIYGMPSTASDDDASFGAEGDAIANMMMADEHENFSVAPKQVVSEPQKIEPTFAELNTVENGSPKTSCLVGSSPHSFNSFEEFVDWCDKHSMQLYTKMNSCRQYCKDNMRIYREVFDRLIGSDWKDKNGKPINNMSKVVFWTLHYVAQDLHAEVEQKQRENATASCGKTKAEIQDDIEEKRRQRLKAAGAQW